MTASDATLIVEAFSPPDQASGLRAQVAASVDTAKLETREAQRKARIEKFIAAMAPQCDPATVDEAIDLFAGRDGLTVSGMYQVAQRAVEESTKH